MFSSPTPRPPPEDPEMKRLRDLEQQRAEQERVRATQDQLQQETSMRGQSFGVSSLVRRRSLSSMLGKG